MNVKSWSFLSLFLFFTTGCFVSEKSDSLLEDKGNTTCISATIAGYDKVLIQFNIPEKALDFRITRDGDSIFQTSDRSLTQTLDLERIPGQTYRYRCEVIMDVNDGFERIGQELVAEMPASDAPAFSGIKSVTAEGPDSATVEWDLTSSQVISHYKVFKYIGIATDRTQFPEQPVATITNITQFQTLITNLGDELDYSFRVSACNSSDICDLNNKILNLSLPDTGRPRTNGATNISIENQVARLTVPWNDSLGLVTERQIYRAEVAYQTSCPTDFASYTELNKVVVSIPRLTPTVISASGSLNEQTSYCFVVRDRDAVGFETNFNIQKVDINDLTPPTLNTTVQLVNNNANNATAESSLIASWTATLNESEDLLRGAHEYEVYISSVEENGTPVVNPCINGTKVGTELAAGHANGGLVSYTINGLDSRNKHRVCIKAKDSSGNIASEDPTSGITNTLDKTPPAFAGIQSVGYSPANGGSLNVGFIVPTATDIGVYKIRVENITDNNAVTLDKNLGSLTPNTNENASVTLAEAGAGDGDSIRVYIDACDNAGDLSFNNQNNCTTTIAFQALTLPDVTGPQGFAGIASATPGTSHRSATINWSAPSSWDDYAGFNVYIEDNGVVTLLESSGCTCTSNDCGSNPLTSCEVSQLNSGQNLVPSKLYAFCVRARDRSGNESSTECTGPTKITASARARDLVSPSFSSTLTGISGSPAQVEFDPATDDQDASVEISYQIFKKNNSDFGCSEPDTCGESIYATVAQSALGTNGSKLVYSDTNVSEGDTYFYQICAVDFGGNRTCQGGTRPSMVIQDVTPPTISDARSNKQVGAALDWTVTFTAADNSTSYDSLVINVYKDDNGFVDHNNLPVPTWSSQNSGVTVTQGANQNTASVTFTDSGSSPVTDASEASTYYVIQVRDLGGNSTFYNIRDMEARPVITQVIWADPINTDGNPIGDSFYRNPAVNYSRVIGTNLDKIDTINESAGGDSLRFCYTSRVTVISDTELRCRMHSNVYFQSNYVNITYLFRGFDIHGRAVNFTAGTPMGWCQHQAQNGQTNMAGGGTEENPYILCRPEHINLINQTQGGTHYTGFFQLGADIDLSSLNGFTGVPEFAPGEVRLIRGLGRQLSNLTIDTSAMNGGEGQAAAFFLGCTGSGDPTHAIARHITFNNFTVRTGNADASIFMLNKSCDYTRNISSREIIIQNSHVYSNGSVGLLAKDYLVSPGEKFRDPQINNSHIHRTADVTNSAKYAGLMLGLLDYRSDSFTGGIGIIESPSVFSSSITGEAGVSIVGDSIGGFAGKTAGTSAHKLNIGGGTVHTSTIENARHHTGGIIGQHRAQGLTVQNIRVYNTNISGPLLVNAALGIGTVNQSGGLTLDYIRIDGTSSVNGRNTIGGVIGNVNGGEITVDDSRIVGQLSLSSSVGASSVAAIGGFIGKADNATQLNFTNNQIERNGSVSIASGGTNTSPMIGSIYQGNQITVSNNRVRNTSINNTGSLIGGLVGSLQGANSVNINQNALYGITLSTSGSRVGGICGQCNVNADINIEDNYLFRSNDMSLPMLVGAAQVAGISPTITGNIINIRRNFVFGSSSATNATQSGAFSFLIDASTSSSIEDNFYINEGFTVPSVIMTNTLEAAGQVEGISRTDAQNQATFTDWDFTNVWEMDNTAGRPKLRIFSGEHNL